MSESAHNRLDLVAIVEKIVGGESPTLEELQYLFYRIFIPIVRKQEQWIASRYGPYWRYPPDHLRTGDDADDPEKEDSEPDQEETAEGCPGEDEREAELIEDEEEEEEEEETIKEREGAAIRSGFIPEVYSELWVVFCQEQKSGNVWEQALKATAAQEDPDCREKELTSYLRKVCANELDRLTGAAGTVSRYVYDRVKEALGTERFASRGDEYFIEGKPFPDYFPADVDPEELITDIEFPPPTGWAEICDAKLPTSEQIAGILLEIMEVHQVQLDIKLSQSIILRGYNLKDRVVESITPPESDSEDGTREVAEIEDVDSEVLPSESDIDAITGAIIGAIEDIDGCPVDPPPADRDQGKLGRLMLDFFLWQKLPVIAGPGSGNKYGFEIYSQLTGYPVSTENNRYKRDMQPLLMEVFSKYQADPELVTVVLEHLRGKYYHRKPEIVDYLPLQ